MISKKKKELFFKRIDNSRQLCNFINKIKIKYIGNSYAEARLDQISILFNNGDYIYCGKMLNNFIEHMNKLLIVKPSTPLEGHDNVEERYRLMWILHFQVDGTSFNNKIPCFARINAMKVICSE